MTIFQTASRVLEAKDKGIAFASFVILDEILMKDLTKKEKKPLLRKAFIEILVSKFDFSAEEANSWADSFELV